MQEVALALTLVWSYTSLTRVHRRHALPMLEARMAGAASGMGGMGSPGGAQPSGPPPGLNSSDSGPAPPPIIEAAQAPAPSKGPVKYEDVSPIWVRVRNGIPTLLALPLSPCSSGHENLLLTLTLALLSPLSVSVLFMTAIRSIPVGSPALRVISI